LKISKLATIGAIVFAAAAAHAGSGLDVTDIGSGVGTFSFEGTKSHGFYVDLDAGTYSFSSVVESSGSLRLGDVWFSQSRDRKSVGPHDIDFTGVGPQEFDGTGSFTLTGPARVYVDVLTIGSKNKGAYNGTLTVSSVPEPATTALLLAGLGMLGFVGRRRRNNG